MKKKTLQLVAAVGFGVAYIKLNPMSFSFGYTCHSLNSENGLELFQSK